MAEETEVPEKWKKKYKASPAELDPVEPVIIVRATPQLVDPDQLDADGKPRVMETLETETKRFRLTKFNVNSNAEKFAQALVKGTQFIPASKVPYIIGLLEQLRERLIEQQQAEGGDTLAATAPAGAVLTKAFSQPGNDRLSSTMGSSAAGGFDEPSTSNFDLRASAPAMPASVGQPTKRPTASSRQQQHDEEEEEAQRQQQQHEEDSLRRSQQGRPGSASRSRGGPSPLDTRDSPPAPASSTSPTFADQRGGSSAAAASGSNGKSRNAGLSASQQRDQLAIQQHIPLTQEEEDELERQQMLKREHEEKLAREARKQRNAKRAEQAMQFAFHAEQSREAEAKRRESQRRKKEKAAKKSSEKAELFRLDEYMETLYDEDMASKIRGTALILKLVQNPAHLDHFIDNDTVLGALARVLREDYKKSGELVTNILEIFFCFSSFRQLAPILTANKVGDTTLKVVQLELARYDLRREKEERARLESLGGGARAAPSPGPMGDISTHYVALGARESSEEKERNKKLTTFLLAQEKLLFVCFYILLNLSEDFAIELKIRNKKIVRHLVHCLSRTGAPYAEDRGFLEELQLLLLTFLKKLSIFEENKRDMKEHEVVKACCAFLNMLLTPPPVTQEFLRAEPHYVPPAPNPELLEATLRLLYNLSFDGDLKREMSLAGGQIGGGWLMPRNFGKHNQSLTHHAAAFSSPPTSPQGGGHGQQLTPLILGGQTFQFDRDLNAHNLFVRFVDLLRKPNPPLRLVAARVLYNISSDLNYRPLVERSLYPDMSVLATLILRCPSKLVDRELMALALNVTLSPEMVDAFITPEVFHALVKRVHQTFDPLLVKLLRNVSSQPNQVHLFAKFMHELVGMTLKAPTHDFLVEALAVLANVTLPEVMYSELMAHHGLLDFLQAHMQPGFADDDILLECVQLLSTLAIDPRAAPMLASGSLVRMLTQLLTDKIEDLDMVVQILFCVFKFLLHRETRAAVLLSQHLTDCLLDLVVDPSAEVRQLANMCLDIIMEHDDVWRDKIRTRRFEAFNREWLQLIATSAPQHHHQHHHAGMGMGGAGGYGDSMGSLGDGSLDDLSGSGVVGGGGPGAYHYPGAAGGSGLHHHAHHHMGELGESAGDLGSYQHQDDESRGDLGDSHLDDSDLSQR